MPAGSAPRTRRFSSSRAQSAADLGSTAPAPEPTARSPAPASITSRPRARRRRTTRSPSPSAPPSTSQRAIGSAAGSGHSARFQVGARTSPSSTGAVSAVKAGAGSTTGSAARGATQ